MLISQEHQINWTLKSQHTTFSKSFSKLMQKPTQVSSIMKSIDLVECILFSTQIEALSPKESVNKIQKIKFHEETQLKNVIAIHYVLHQWRTQDILCQKYIINIHHNNNKTYNSRVS